MSVFKVRGINIEFPYEKPYDIQIDYMSKVIDCLEDKKHGVLESPTGTGKTLCLFAPVTSWLRAKKIAMHFEKHMRNEDPNVEAVFWGKKQKVWYTARTHSQIAQTVAEVRRCNTEGLAIRVMGARDQLCINPLVLSEKESFIKTAKCKELVKTRSCRFHRRLEYSTHAPAIYQPGEVLDIEDLAAAGRSCGVCPYFLAKAAKDQADIVLMPYNYVIDRESRGNAGGTYDSDIVIFDEGHNVPNTCEESFEFSFTSVDLALGIRNIQELMEALVNMKEIDEGSEDSLNIYQHADNAKVIWDFLQNIEKEFSEISESPQLYPLSNLFEIFHKIGVTQKNAQNYLTILELFQSDSHKLQINGPTQFTFNLIEKILQTLFGSAISSFPPDMIEKSFKFAVSPDPESIKNSKKLSLFCFNPSFGIRDILLQGVQSLIITSGTLSPLRSFIHELSLPDPITLENGHIASKSQVPFMVLGTGVNNVKMDASFKNRKEPAFMYSLGMTLTNLISSVPDGVLLLFSSYSIMLSLKEFWENDGGIWNRLNSLKRVFLEPRGKEDFINCMENYRRAIDAGNGAILMGVLRGKISEGMDFKDQYCRAVFIVGVPFPPVMDPRVKGKEKYSDTLFVQNPVTKRQEKLYESSFLSVEAMKATNQAIGRVIRHGGDYGAIILVDYRFAWPRLFHNISRWLRGDVPSEVNFMTAKKTLREFFKNLHSGNLGVTEVRRQQVQNNGDPVAGEVKYDIYDHKKATSQVPAPWIATSMDSGSFRGNKTKYIDGSDEEVDIMSKYSSTSKNRQKSVSTIKNFTESSKKIKTEPIPEPSSLLDSLHKTSATPSQPGYREVDDNSLNCELQKRKNDELSPSILSSQKKKSRRKVMSNLESYDAEPESIPSKPSNSSADNNKATLKADLVNYIVQVKTSLDPDDGVQFKNVVWRYMKGTASLSETITVLQSLLQEHPRFLEFMQGFNICVKSKDRNAWNQLSFG